MLKSFLEYLLLMPFSQGVMEWWGWLIALQGCFCNACYKRAHVFSVGCWDASGVLSTRQIWRGKGCFKLWRSRFGWGSAKSVPTLELKSKCKCFIVPWANFTQFKRGQQDGSSREPSSSASSLLPLFLLWCKGESHQELLSPNGPMKMSPSMLAIGKQEKVWTKAQASFPCV